MKDEHIILNAKEWLSNTHRITNIYLSRLSLALLTICLYLFLHGILLSWSLSGTH